MEIFPKNEYMTLEQSYRTTVEIMEAANRVISHIQEASPAVPVIRHGPAVQLYIMEGLNARADGIDKKLADYKKSGYRSIAVICKTMNECKALKKLLKHPITIITGLEEQYEGGLLILPAYLVKGLEFDAVIIANTDNYSMEDLDIRLLYVAMTRALHELALFSAGEPGELCRSLVTPTR
jgi:DNA helicase-2/ATP-dependent DNA helicase PcrA